MHTCVSESEMSGPNRGIQMPLRGGWYPYNDKVIPHPLFLEQRRDVPDSSISKVNHRVVELP